MEENGKIDIGNNLFAEPDEQGIDAFEASAERKPIKNILVVDDEKPIQDLLKEGLEKFGYKVSVAGNGVEGMDLFRENPADLIITDIFMPEQDGHTFIHRILQEFPETKIFAITGHKSFEPEPYIDLNIAKALGAVQVFTKPIKINDLLEVIKKL
jgi:CheY-like chemotaxis protein